MDTVVTGIFRPHPEMDSAEARETEEYRRTVSEFVAEMTRVRILSGYEAAQWKQWILSDDDVLARCMQRRFPPGLIERLAEGDLSLAEIVEALMKNKTPSPI